MSVRHATVVLALLLAACLGDPVGPGALTVSLEAGTADTVWNGAPGEALPMLRVRVRDEQGRPVPAASIRWQAFGTAAVLENAETRTNSAGEATALWKLGTNAAEEQRLQIGIQTTHHAEDLVLRARAVPHIVTSLRITSDSVLRVGDTLALHVDAVDPYGNVFAAPDLHTFVTDTTRGSVAGAGIVGGPRRGQLIAVATSHTVAMSVPIHVTQFVAAVVPVRGTIQFTSLGAAFPVSYVVRDDRGRVVTDTSAALALSDTTVALLSDTTVVARRPGSATLALTLGPVAASVPISVDQRIASIQLRRDTIRFTALLDTTTIHPVVRDSLGFPIYQPAVVAQVHDSGVAELQSSFVVKAVTPGQTTVTVSDPETGVYTTIPVVVHQLVTSIAIDPIAFDALGDTATARVVAVDRLGSVVTNPSLTYEVTDSAIAQVDPSGRLRSVAPGLAMLIVHDQETPTAMSAEVTIHQRITAVTLDVDSLAFDALRDTARLHVTARDRLGADVADAAARTSYSSSNSSVVDVDAAGTTIPVGNGSALVIAQSSDGPADTTRIEVSQRVDRVVLNTSDLRFDALNAEAVVAGTAFDRLGSLIVGAPFSYVVEDTVVARVDASGRVHALHNGSTVVSAAASGKTATSPLVVSQRPFRVVVPADTVRFTAIGDTAALSATAVDSLGSPVSGALSDVQPGNPAVVASVDSVRVRAAGNGTTQLVLRVAGITGTVTAMVEQVPVALSAAIDVNQPILTLPVGALLPISCVALDRNGVVAEGMAMLEGTAAGTVTGSSCSNLRVQHSGYDTLTLHAGTVETRVPVIVAAKPIPSSALGDFVTSDSILAPSGPWAPSFIRNAAGELELYYAAFSAKPDSTGVTRGDLHRLTWVSGNQFRYDTLMLRHNDNICSLDGQGIENVAIVPRNDGAGLRMFYSAGSNKCYGWQVFSAVSTDGREWTKETGRRLSNGGDSTVPAPWPAGEGMVVDQLPDGTWRMIAGTFEHVSPFPVNKWQITEWHSSNQLDWQYQGTVLTTRDMPTGWQGSVYSPTIREFAPGLWRMVFTADGRGTPGSRSAIWSAVSTDRAHWQIEGEVVGATGSNLFYAALIDDHLVYIRQDGNSVQRLAIATVAMP